MILSRYIWRILLYSVILLAEILLAQSFLFPLAEKHFGSLGHLGVTIVTVLAMLPFLMALCFSSTKPSEKMQLHQSAAFYDVPLLVMKIIRYLVALIFIVYFTTVAYSSIVGWLVGVGCFILVLVFASTKLMKHYGRIERKFIDNLNMRENERLGRNNNVVDDLHQAFIEVDLSSPFVGDRLKDSGLRRDYGVSVTSIQRGDDYMPLPSKDARIFPGDILGVLGNDEQLLKLNKDLEEAKKQHGQLPSPSQKPVELSSIVLSESSPIVGVPLGNTDILHDYSSMIVKVLRGAEFLSPAPSLVLEPGDVAWVVGDPEYMQKMK